MSNQTSDQFTEYSKRIATLCVTHRIENPIKETDLTVATIDFFHSGQWHKVEATQFNKGGRLFFQDQVQREGRERTSDVGNPRQLKISARRFFGPLWYDAETVGRTLVFNLKRASEIRVHWKC